MTVILFTTAQTQAEKPPFPWCCLPGSRDDHGLDPSLRLPGLAASLENSFDTIRDRLWELGRSLGRGPRAHLAHTPTCTTYGSDLALTMAWCDLIGHLAAQSDPVVVICDDPWIFRHLQNLPGVTAGKAPSLAPARLKAWLRGYAARTAYALKSLCAWRSTRKQRSHHGQGNAAIVVFGHPLSNANGSDAYFGQLMVQLPQLRRLMHTDCDARRALELGADGRTAALHAWGSPFTALMLPWATWRPTRNDLQGPWQWLVRRAAVHESAGAAAASQVWQDRCQRRWLADRQPHTIAWPWENHPWERNIIHAARPLGVRTLGYQHTVVGRHMYNQSPQTNIDGLDGLPDIIVCNGPAYHQQLYDWGIPLQRLVIGGAFRVATATPLRYDPAGPIFVALSHDMNISGQMITAITQIDDGKRLFLIKEHPMYPSPLTETPTIRRTSIPLPQHDGLAAVLFSTGTVGLEAILGGLPTLRFQPEGIVAMHITPPGVDPIDVNAQNLGAILATDLPRPASHAWSTVFAEPNMAVWRSYLDRAIG